jgi:glutathione S-transferase
MKLFYSKGSCSLAARITIHEMKADCEYELVDLRKKLYGNNQDYYQINPHGYVPALQLDNGEILTENVAVQIYLAEKFHATNLLPPVTDMKRYHVIEWLSYVATEIHKNCGPLFNSSIPVEINENIFKPMLIKKLAGLDAHLAENKFLVGDQFTIADSYLFVILTWMPHFNIDFAQWPNLDRYFNEIKNRPSVQQSWAEGA